MKKIFIFIINPLDANAMAQISIKDMISITQLVITCFGNGSPLELVLKFFKLGTSTFRNRNNDTLITLNKNGEKQKKIEKRID